MRPRSRALADFLAVASACRARMLMQRPTLNGRLTMLSRPRLIADRTESTDSSDSISENVVPNCSSRWLSEVPMSGNPTAPASLTAGRLKSTRGV